MHPFIIAFSEKAELSYSYRVGKMDGVFQRGNKIKLGQRSCSKSSFGIERKQLMSSNSYMSIENTGDSYNVKPLADNMDLYSGGASDTKTANQLGNKI